MSTSFLDSEDLDPLRGYVPSPSSRYPASYFTSPSTTTTTTANHQKFTSNFQHFASSSSSSSTSPSPAAHQEEQRRYQNQSGFSPEEERHHHHHQQFASSSAQRSSSSPHHRFSPSSSSPSPQNHHSSSSPFNQHAFNMSTTASSNNNNNNAHHDETTKTAPPSPTPIRQRTSVFHHDDDDNEEERNVENHHQRESNTANKYDHDAYSPLPTKSRANNHDDDDDAHDDQSHHDNQHQYLHPLFTSSARNRFRGTLDDFSTTTSVVVDASPAEEIEHSSSDEKDEDEDEDDEDITSFQQHHHQDASNTTSSTSSLFMSRLNHLKVMAQELVLEFVSSNRMVKEELINTLGQDNKYENNDEVDDDTTAEGFHHEEETNQIKETTPEHQSALISYLRKVELPKITQKERVTIETTLQQQTQEKSNKQKRVEKSAENCRRKLIEVTKAVNAASRAVQHHENKVNDLVDIQTAILSTKKKLEENYQKENKIRLEISKREQIANNSNGHLDLNNNGDAVYKYKNSNDMSRLDFVISLRTKNNTSSNEVISRWNLALEHLGVETVQDLKTMMKYNRTAWESEDVLKNEPLLKALCCEKLMMTV